MTGIEVSVPPFAVVPPRGAPTPLIVEVPHAGLLLDAEALAHLVMPAESLARDADSYVDELYAGAPEVGANLLVSHLSRYVVDLNRAETDVDAESVEGAPKAPTAPRGVVWRLSSEGRAVLRRPVPRVEVERRLSRYYRPYHAALGQLIAEAKARFGFAIVLAAHSMPSVGRAGHADPRSVRADVVPGTRGKTSAAPSFIAAVERVAHDFGATLQHDTPYRGGFTTAHYGRPADNVHVVQIELARRLYMNEATLARNTGPGGGFEATQALCQAFAQALSRTTP